MNQILYFDKSQIYEKNFQDIIFAYINIREGIKIEDFGCEKIGDLLYELYHLEYLNLKIQRNNQIGDFGKNYIIKNLVKLENLKQYYFTFESNDSILDYTKEEIQAQIEKAQA